MRRPVLLLLALVSIAGCGGKDTAEPPAELQPIQSTLNIRKVWSSKVGGGSERLRLGLRPTTDGARVYAGARDGTIAAFDAETGARLWSVNTKLDLAAGPSFSDGRLALGTTDGDLLVVDAENGKQLWREPVGSEILAPPALNADVVVFGTVDGRLRAYSADTGTPLWSVEQTLPALTLRGNTAPYITGNTVVAGFDNGRVAAYGVAGGDAVWEVAIASAAGRNELERLDDISAGLQVAGNDVYAAAYHGRAADIDLRTGVIVWQQELSSFAGLGVDANNVYVTNDVGYVIALDRRSGAEVWRQQALRLRDVTAPTRYLNAIVVGDYEGYLHWLSPEDGHFLGRVRAASERISAAPLVVGPRLVIQSDGGAVTAFAVADETE